MHSPLFMPSLRPFFSYSARRGQLSSQLSGLTGSNIWLTCPMTQPFTCSTLSWFSLVSSSSFQRLCTKEQAVKQASRTMYLFCVHGSTYHRAHIATLFQIASTILYVITPLYAICSLLLALVTICTQTTVRFPRAVKPLANAPVLLATLRHC